MRSLPPFLVLLALLATPVAALAARLEGVPRVATAGSTLELTWSDLSAHADEVELELSLDGGRWIRATAEHDAASGRLTWRVPALMSGHARLRLRAGGTWAEAVVAHSGVFVIEGVAPAPRPNPATAAHWWTAFASPLGGAEGLTCPHSSLSPAMRATDAENPQGSRTLIRPDAATPRSPEHIAESLPSAARTRRTATGFRPLRI